MIVLVEYLVKYLKYYKCQMKNVRVFFSKKNKRASNVSKMSNSARNDKKNFLVADGGFAAVSTQFQNKHHESNCHTKAHCCNSFFG